MRVDFCARLAFSACKMVGASTGCKKREKSRFVPAVEDADAVPSEKLPSAKDTVFPLAASVRLTRLMAEMGMPPACAMAVMIPVASNEVATLALTRGRAGRAKKWKRKLCAAERGGRGVALGVRLADVAGEVSLEITTEGSALV